VRDAAPEAVAAPPLPLAGALAVAVGQPDGDGE